MTRTYQQSRPALPAALAREVMVEAGHCCAISNCGEHSYLEIHHIDEDRENNRLENLILLCRKHHAMTHRGVIDRKSLRAYKDRLKPAEMSEIRKRLEQLEAAMSDEKQRHMPEMAATEDQPAGDVALKSAPRRFEVLQFALYHVAISKLEQDIGIHFSRNVTFRSGDSELTLDGLRAFEDGPDLLVDVHYLRKSYLDAPGYGAMVARKVDLYELLTGRPATGILLAVVGRERMLEPGGLRQTREGVEPFENVALHIYSCEQIGYHPGPVSAGLFELIEARQAGEGNQGAA